LSYSFFVETYTLYGFLQIWKNLAWETTPAAAYIQHVLVGFSAAASSPSAGSDLFNDVQCISASIRKDSDSLIFWKVAYFWYLLVVSRENNQMIFLTSVDILGNGKLLLLGRYRVENHDYPCAVFFGSILFKTHSKTLLVL
jgi:hypothetical protein